MQQQHAHRAPAPARTPEQRTAILAGLATASAAEVGLLHGVSRNAVLGLAHRARMAGQAVPTRVTVGEPVLHARKAVPVPAIQPRAPTVGTPAPTPRRDPVPLPVSLAGPVPAPLGRVTLLDAGPRVCRAIADTDDALICGHPALDGGPWCPAHAALYRRPAKLIPVSMRRS